MDRSLRRLGQLLVVMGALLGAVLGVSLALIVEHAETSGAVVGPGREGAAVLAASPPSTAPPASRATRTQDPGNDTDASGNQPAESAGRADLDDGKAGKNSDRRKDKADGHGKDKPGKAKGNQLDAGQWTLATWSQASSYQVVDGLTHSAHVATLSGRL